MSRWDVFDGQVVCITGAASGFGKLMSEHLSRAGAKLVICDINEAPLKAVASGLAHPDQALAMVCDVAVEDQVAAVVAALRRNPSFRLGSCGEQGSAVVHPDELVLVGVGVQQR